MTHPITLLLVTAVSLGAGAAPALGPETHCVRRIDRQAFDTCMAKCHVIQGEPYCYRARPEECIKATREFLRDHVTMECPE